MAFIKENFLTLCLVVALTAASFIAVPSFSGYSFGTGVHSIYLPALYHAADPHLFDADPIIAFNQTDYSFFGVPFVFLFKNFGISFELSFVVAAFISRFIFLFAVWRLGLTFMPKGYEVAALFAVVPLLSATQIFVPQSIAIPLCLLALVLMLEMRFIVSAIILSVVFVIHPISTPAFFVLLSALCATAIVHRKYSLAAGFCAALIPLVTVYAFFKKASATGGLEYFSHLDPLWRSIIAMRVGLATDAVSSFLHPIQSYSSLWYFLFSFFVFTLFSVLAYRRMTREQLWYLGLIFTVPLILSVVQFFGVVVFNSSIVLGLQLARAFILWDILLVFSCFYFVWWAFNEQPQSYVLRMTAVAFLLGALIRIPLVDRIVLSLIALPVLSVYVYAEFVRILWCRIFRKPEYLNHIGAALGGFLSLTACIFIYLFSTISVMLVVGFLIMLSIVLLSVYTIIAKRNDATLLVVYFLILVCVVGAATNRIHYLPSYSADADLHKMCDWINMQTAQGAIFMTQPFVEPGPDPIRLGCKRQVFVVDIEGDQTILNRAFAMSWKERMDALSVVLKGDAERVAVAKQYNISYLLADTLLDTKLTVVYAAGKYTLYSLKP